MATEALELDERRPAAGDEDVRCARVRAALEALAARRIGAAEAQRRVDAAWREFAGGGEGGE